MQNYMKRILTTGALALGILYGNNSYAAKNCELKDSSYIQLTDSKKKALNECVKENFNLDLSAVKDFKYETLSSDLGKNSRKLTFYQVPTSTSTSKLCYQVGELSRREFKAGTDESIVRKCFDYSSTSAPQKDKPKVNVGTEGDMHVKLHKGLDVGMGTFFYKGSSGQLPIGVATFGLPFSVDRSSSTKHDRADFSLEFLVGGSFMNTKDEKAYPTESGVTGGGVAYSNSKTDVTEANATVWGMGLWVNDVLYKNRMRVGVGGLYQDIKEKTVRNTKESQTFGGVTIHNDFSSTLSNKEYQGWDAYLGVGVRATDNLNVNLYKVLGSNGIMGATLSYSFGGTNSWYTSSTAKAESAVPSAKPRKAKPKAKAAPVQPVQAAPAQLPTPILTIVPDVKPATPPANVQVSSDDVKK